VVDLGKNRIAKKQKSLVQDNKILLLGRKIELDIRENKLLKNGGFCNFNEETLVINISPLWTQELLENILKTWYTDICFDTIKSRVNYYAEKYNFHYKNITIKECKTKWGSCDSKNNLMFSWKIMLFDLTVLDYLVVHELVHTIHKNHSKDFWASVGKILPNYRFLRRKLKQ